jgi:hypothetical protein
LFVYEAGHWRVEADLTWHNALTFWITRAVGLKKDALSNDLVKKNGLVLPSSSSLVVLECSLKGGVEGVVMLGK